MRLQNLRGLRLDRHLVRHGKALHIVVPGEEVKNGADLEFVPEPRTRELLEWDVATHRQVLADPGSQALFPGGVDGTKGPFAMRKGIMDAIRKHLGVTLNPHAFRHLSARLYLDRNPGDYETVRRLLGHKSIETTVAFYCGSETRSATRHYQSVVVGLREAGARS